MVNTRSVLGALALIAPLAAAAPTTTTMVVTKTKIIYSTVYSTVTKTQTEFSNTVVTSVKTMTVKKTATAPVTTTTTTATDVTTASASTVTMPASTVTESASTVTLPASTVTMTTTITTPTTVSGSCSATTQTGQTTTRTALQATGTMGLNDYATMSNRYLGTAVDIPGAEESDQQYMTIANNTHEFGSRTPANIMKYYATEPQQGVFDFSGGDHFIAMAHGAGINHIRCHNLIWHSQLPSWLTSGTWDNATLVKILQNHVTQLVTHWGDNCTHWDVVNEAFNDDGTWRTDLWYNTIGYYYIPLAFQAAQAAVEANNLSVKLYYNDYNTETAGAKSTMAQTLVKNLTALGIQIDGVGFQSHFVVNATTYFPYLQSNLQAFTALNVDVALTELDVRVQKMPPNSGDELSQYNDYKWPVEACYNTPRCVGVTVWDFSDQYSWVPSTFPGQGYADIYGVASNGQYYKKIAWDGIQQGFIGGNQY